MVNTLKTWWGRLSHLPGGKWLFSKMIAWFIPYTGTIGARVIDVGPAYAQVCMYDRRCTRNHLRCLHALALTNLGELTTGLAVHFALSPHQQAILTHIESDFLKKARGTIVATAHYQEHIGPGLKVVEAQLSDSAGEVVTRVRASWLIGERK